MSTVDSLVDMPVEAGCIAEYVWIDGYNKVRGKARYLPNVPSSPADLPDWNYDGSSTGQAPGADSEVILKAQTIFPDPFRGKPNILVMCDTYSPEGAPLPTNTRYECALAMSAAASLEPWFGLEQEYFLINPETGKPIGFPAKGEPQPQGPYYCGVSGSKMYGRDIVDAHFKACVYAGIKISGINAEVAPGQWEFQVGPAVGIEQGDMLWMARYMLERIAEMKGLDVNYDPKPIKGDWNGSGCHANFSTKPMREAGGYEQHIIPALHKLENKHAEHIAAYGSGNEERLTGKHETASINEFKWGVADRGASCRVGSDTAEKGYGYFEDRRPAGNCDPYVVTRMLVQTCCLDE
ncbi:Glutamine synthetase PR-1 [Gracilariopsis chorda]|uniref:Glutamine synthetase n=1 Tax=Gracilariopsis chorda TaxID=448386 RepID=A0A2V3IVE5_9FLOR|nr:Glutamine synthetase PR-1 [Gracilariopsis chorda]|eukprot:PXF46116.1 Glutamine synthetase PR-1 [Gracilariopsis chorda]